MLANRTAMLGAVLAALMCISGCASQIQVTYQSDPPGATLYQGNSIAGSTPFYLTYEPDEAFKNGGCMRLNGTRVQWASGASASIDYLTVCSNLGYNQVYGFSRPNVPGREIDANYALQREQNAIMQQSANAQSQAARTAAAAQMYRVLNPPRPVYVMPAPVYSAPINCTSQRFGNTVNTQCF